jgi:hypothetical protein
MEITYRVDSRQDSQLIFDSLSHQSNTCKDQMNGSTKYFSTDGAIDCQYGKDGTGRGCS